MSGATASVIASASRKLQSALPPELNVDEKTSQTFIIAVMIVMTCLLVSCIISSIWSSIRSSSSEDFKNVEQKRQRTHYIRF